MPSARRRWPVLGRHRGQCGPTGAAGARPRYRSGAAPGSPGAAPRFTSPLVALLWLGPALLLIAGVVIYPAIELVQASFTRFSITGLRIGSAGTGNYSKVLHHRDLVTVLTNTVVWVVAVLVLTVLVSLAWPSSCPRTSAGAPIVRWAIIVPWAASLVITARLFTLIYDYYHGILNEVLLRLHVI